MRLRHLTILAAIAVATPVIAHQDAQLPGAVDVSRVTAGTYAADPNHTLVGWRVNHFGFSDYFGIFGSVSGTLSIDPANLAAAKVDVTIPVAKITTANPALTAHLLKPGADGKAPDFFGPAPADAHFVSTSVTVDGTEAEIQGKLTLNGVTKDVTLDAQFTGAGANPMSKKQTIGFSGSTTIKRSDYGVAAFVPLVSDEVTLDIAAAFEKQ